MNFLITDDEGNVLQCFRHDDRVTRTSVQEIANDIRYMIEELMDIETLAPEKFPWRGQTFMRDE